MNKETILRSIALFLVLSAQVRAKTIKCDFEDSSLTVEAMNPSDLLVFYRDESSLADGLMDESVVDLVVKFPTYGEMTLFAKIGQQLPDNYVFLSGTRKNAFCR